MKEGRKFNKIVSLVLAAVMMVSVFAVTTPQEVEAASTINKEIKGTGTTTVRIAKKDSYAYSNKETLIKFKPKKNGYVDLHLVLKSPCHTCFHINHLPAIPDKAKPCYSLLYNKTPPYSFPAVLLQDTAPIFDFYLP